MLRALDRLLASMILLGLFSTAVYFAGVAFFALVPPAVGSFAAHVSRIQAEEARGDRIRQSGYERHFRNLCPDYYAQPLYVRWTGYRDLRWCEDFRERF